MHQFQNRITFVSVLSAFADTSFVIRKDGALSSFVTLRAGDNVIREPIRGIEWHGLGVSVAVDWPRPCDDDDHWYLASRATATGQVQIA